MSDAIKDEIARIAMQDMFGATPEGQVVKENYQKTGRVHTADETIKQHRTNEATPGYTVVTPIDYKKIAAAVSEQQLAESLVDEPYTKEKDSAITSVANEACEESKTELAKILRRLR